MDRNINQEYHVNDQYKDSSNLDARANLHKKYGLNQYGFFQWVFDKIKFQGTDKILEIGCGTGELWFQNKNRIITGQNMILSDISQGMIEKIQKKLSNIANIKFRTFDAKVMPFDTNSFDVVPF